MKRTVDVRRLHREAFAFKVLGEGSAIVDGELQRGTRCEITVTAEQEVATA